jgi:hypothetical protein
LLVLSIPAKKGSAKGSADHFSQSAGGSLEMELLKACEIAASLGGLIALFGALFAGLSWLAAIGIAIGVAVLIMLMCPVKGRPA